VSKFLPKNNTNSSKIEIEKAKITNFHKNLTIEKDAKSIKINETINSIKQNNNIQELAEENKIKNKKEKDAIKEIKRIDTESKKINVKIFFKI